MAELISEAESAMGKRAFLRIPLPRRVVEAARNIDPATVRNGKEP